MAQEARLPHLQRPVYQNLEPANTQPVSQPAPRPTPTQQKISSDSLPRPLQSRDEPFKNLSSLAQQPSVDSIYTVIENSVSSSKFLRFSLNNIPVESSQLSSIGLSFGAIWQPLAELSEEDDAVGLVQGIPFRCTRCFAYVNPYFKFIDGGRKVVCNICELTLDAPDIYSNDRASRKEMYSGTYEFTAPPEYFNRPTQLPLYLFCIDTSQNGLALGLVQQVLSSIIPILDYIPETASIGIITFDSAIHIYKVLANGDLKEILMTDINDPFIPEPVAGCCYNPATQREAIENLCNRLLVHQFSTPGKTGISIGCLLHAVKESILKSIGGRVLVFTSQPGQVGKYPMASRPEHKFIHSEVDKNYHPAEGFAGLAQELSGEDVCVDIFMCGSAAHSNTLGFLCSQTGGDFYYFPGYKSETDGERIYYLITRILTRPQASQIVMRARCSNGLSIDYYIGKYKRKGPVEMEIPCIDSDKAICLSLKYDEKLKENNEYHVQCAMLYTNSQGKRLIRINNGKVIATRSVINIFKSADLDALNSVFLKTSLFQLFEQSLNNVRETWHSNIVKIMVTHRLALGDHDGGKVLIPDSLRLLPLYCSSSLKLPCLTLASVSADFRVASVHQMLGASILAVRLLVYPKVYSLDDVMEQSNYPGCLNDLNVVALPRLVPCSHEYLKNEGVYLLNNGEFLMIWVGNNVKNEFVYRVWGMENVEELKSNPDYWVLRDVGTEESQRVLAVIDEVRRRNPGAYAPVSLFFAGISDEVSFRRLMVEDNNASEFSYGDFLMRVHRVVMNKIQKS